MTSTYEMVATNTLSSTASSVTFSSISSAYTDLIIVSYIRGSTAQNQNLRFNNDTGSNYSNTYIEGDGTGGASGRRTSQTSLVDFGFLRTAASTFASGIIQIMNYSNTTTYKTVLSRADLATLGTQASVGLWQNNSAINRVDLICGSGSYQAGSTFTIYGIKAE
jgi:hypothetical protein